MKIKVEPTLKIGAVRVLVFYEDKLLDNHGKYGQARFAECEIALQNRDMANDSKTQAFLHEVVHWLDHTYTSYSLDEKQTDALATGLHILLDDLNVKLDFSEIKRNKKGDIK